MVVFIGLNFNVARDFFFSLFFGVKGDFEMRQGLPNLRQFLRQSDFSQTGACTFYKPTYSA